MSELAVTNEAAHGGALLWPLGKGRFAHPKLPGERLSLCCRGFKSSLLSADRLSYDLCDERLRFCSGCVGADWAVFSNSYLCCYFFHP